MIAFIAVLVAILVVGALLKLAAWLIDRGDPFPAQPAPAEGTEGLGTRPPEIAHEAFLPRMHDELTGPPSPPRTSPAAPLLVAESQVRAGSPAATGPHQIPPHVVNRQGWSLSAADGRELDKGLPEESDWSRLPPPPESSPAAPPAHCPPGAGNGATPRPGTAAAAGGAHPPASPPPLPEGPAGLALLAAACPGAEPFAAWENDDFVEAVTALKDGAAS